MIRAVRTVVLALVFALAFSASASAEPVYLNAALASKADLAASVLSEDVIDVAFDFVHSAVYMLTRSDQVYRVRRLNLEGGIQWSQDLPRDLIPFSYLYLREDALRCLASRGTADGQRVGVEVSLKDSEIQVQAYPDTGLSFQHALAPRREDRIHKLLAAGELRPLVFTSPPGSVVESGSPWSFPANAPFIMAHRLGCSESLDTVGISNIPFFEISIAQLAEDGSVRRESLPAELWQDQIRLPGFGATKVLSIAIEADRLAIGITYKLDTGTQYAVLSARRVGGKWIPEIATSGLLARTLGVY